VRLFAQSEPALRLFLRSLLPRWEDTDEVLQETSLVLWRKFDSFTEGTHFLRWACMVARFEALKYRRGKARDRHVFDEELLQVLADEAVEEVASLDSERRALEQCLQKLGPRERAWVEAVYGSNTQIREVAVHAGRSAGSLYKALHRIRISLLECVNRSLAATDPS
jgi:RNA polymerase sigma-70 factor (ECF subfamily)